MVSNGLGHDAVPFPAIPPMIHDRLITLSVGTKTVKNVQQNARRNDTLDFTKGALVLFMILYHWINYFVGVGGTAFTYLRFIPPSFVFLAGFMIANVYPAKYGLDSLTIYKRLIVRGLKLLFLFTLLNVVANLVIMRSYRQALPGIDSFLQDAAQVYIIGNVKAVFSILVPISYLLLISALILVLARRTKTSLQWIFLCLGATAIILDIWGAWNSHLMLLGVGLLGVSCGFTPIEVLEKWVDHPYGVLVFNVGYLVLLTLWGEDSLLQVLGVYLSVAAFYLLGMKKTGRDQVRDMVTLLGKYSLFAYLGQIALLQLLFRSLPYLNLDYASLLITSFFAAYVLTIGMVKVAHEARKRSPRVDLLYQAAFS